MGRVQAHQGQVVTARAGSRLRLWGPEEVAEHLGLTVKTLRNWRSRGIGPPGFLIGGAVRYRQEAVYAWVDAQADA